MSRNVDPEREGPSATVSDATGSSGGASISISDLTKTFADGTIVACEEIDLDIHSDEFVVLLGPSGCGKTTTLRCIAGLETPDSGRILVGDEDVTFAKPKDRDLAFVFQEIALFPHMTVEENMRFGLDMKTDLSAEEKKKRIEETATILGIEDMLDRKPRELSGGQQQRVSLGRAMVMEPAAFLLDEPFSALDANLRDQMRVEVKKLHRRLDRAMVFVTHDQEEAMTLGDKIVVMENGQIQQVGSPHDIYNEPENLFIAQFIGSPSTNFFECAVEAGPDGLRVEAEHFSVTVDELPERDLDGGALEGAMLGVRPEFLELEVDDPLFEADVSVIESYGARDAVHMDLDGQALTAVTEQNAIESDDRTVAVSFEPNRAWIFDADGERVV